MTKVADKYGIEVRDLQINDYIGHQPVHRGEFFDGVLPPAWMHCPIPSAGWRGHHGADRPCVLNGNDGLVMKDSRISRTSQGPGNQSGSALSCFRINLLAGRGQRGMSERDVTVVNTGRCGIRWLLQHARRERTW